jgi:hypothetical protein
MRSVAVLLAAALLGLSSGARAAFITPGGNTVVDFQPSKYEFGDSFSKARTATGHNGYAVIVSKWQTAASYNPSVGFVVFISAVGNDYAALLTAQHGVVELATGVALFGMEQFPDDSTGMNAAINRVISFQNTYGIDPSDMKVVHYPGYCWYIAITANLIAAYRNTNTYDLAYVFAATCESYKVRSGFRAAGFAGYDYEPTNSTALSEANDVWDQMDGTSGREYRTLGQAVFGTTLSCDPAASSMVLAPAISDYTYAGDGVSGTITFDAEMDQTANCDVVLQTSGSISVYGAYWNGNQIAYDLACDYDGTGKVAVSNYYATSVNGLQLNPDGSGSNTETYAVSYSCAGGINPAAALDNFVAVYDGGAVRVRWTTEWERNTASFQIRRIASDGSASLLPEVPAHGPGAYEVVDPAGSFLEQYQLVEHQTGSRRDLTYGPVSTQPAFTPVTAEPVTYDPDEVQATLESIPEPSTNGPESIGMYQLAIVCPDSFVTTAQSHANLWISRGVSATVVSLTEAAARGGIKATLASLYSVSTRYAILVGDASDYVEFSDPANWPDTNWVQPDWPLQPERNLIPTFYVRENAASPITSLSWFTRYFATDVPYADVDDNGLSDLILGRIPAHTNADYQAYVAKLTTHLNTPPTASHANKASMFEYAVDFGTVPGDPYGAQADALATHFPATVTLSKMIDRNGPPTTWTTTQLDSIFRAHFNAGRSFEHIGSTNASRSNYAFTSIQWGFSMSQLAANNKFPVILGTSCDMADFDRTENPAQGTPMCERLLFDPNKGAIVIVGPSRGTFQLGNVEFAERFIDAVYSLGAKNVGTAFVETQRAMIAEYPHFAKLARSYMLLGDPLVAPIGAPAVTAVGDAPAAPHAGLAPPSPNPFNPVTSLTIHLAVRSQAHLAVYDVRGRLVRTLADRILPAGPTRLKWNGTDDNGRPSASGVYFARLTAPAVTQTHKLVLLK